MSESRSNFGAIAQALFTCWLVSLPIPANADLFLEDPGGGVIIGDPGGGGGPPGGGGDFGCGATGIGCDVQFFPILPSEIVVFNGVPQYIFNVNVQSGQSYPIDPIIAIGYDYRIGSGNPNFASVKLPSGVGDGQYDLYLFDAGQYVFEAELNAGFEHLFGVGGVDRFRILGIEPSAGLDPNNPQAFVTDLSFVAAGQFTGTMTPIITAIPEPASLGLLGLGFAAMLVSRRRGSNP